VIVLKRKKSKSNIKTAIMLIITIFIVSTFIVIQPFSKTALSNSTAANKTALYLEAQSSQKNTEITTNNKNIPIGETKLPSGPSGGATIVTTTAGQNNPSTESYPSKIGTISVIGGSTISAGTIGK